MKRRVICIAATALCVAMTSMAYAKEIETTTEDDETYYTLEVNETIRYRENSFCSFGGRLSKR